MDKSEKIRELRQELDEFLSEWHGAENAYALAEAYGAVSRLRNAEALLDWGDTSEPV